MLYNLPTKKLSGLNHLDSQNIFGNSLFLSMKSSPLSFMKKKKPPVSFVCFQPNEKTRIKINMTEFARNLVQNKPLSGDEIFVHCILKVARL